MLLFNTLTRRKEQFKPLRDREVLLYTCGPTVYDYAHVGNLRAYLAWDLLKRVLKFNSFRVKHVMNYTDVGHLASDADEGEDKMELGAERERKSAWDIADFYINAFDEDAEKLKLQRPDMAPRATEEIKEMLSMVEELEKRGLTYIIEDGVYFDTSKFKDYGKMARLDIKGLKAGARVEIAHGKKHATDFALWKFSPKDKKREMEWDSKWGKGFPGWHLECSVMAMKYLGKTIDIHCGGVDHIPVHHTNEIAQSESVTGKPFSKYWLHNDFMLVDGKKMAKSLGNFYTLRDLEEKGFHPLAFRYLCLSVHYRTQMNFTLDALRDADNAIKTLNDFVFRIDNMGEKREENKRILAELKRAKEKFIGSVNDDMNMPEALSAVFSLVGAVNREIDAGKADTKTLRKVKEFFLDVNQILDVIEEKKVELTSEERKLIELREHFRRNRDFKAADEIRRQLKEKGIIIEDTPKGAVWRKTVS